MSVVPSTVVVMEMAWVADTDGQAAAAALVAAHAAQLEAEATEFALAAHWAALHDEDSIAGAGTGRTLPGAERARRAGGHGTPFVAEFAAAELGVLTGRGRFAAQTLVADAVDVQHRLPQLWTAVMELRVRVWQARKIASRLRAVDLDREQARWVDAQVTPYLPSLPWARIEALLEAKIIEADPDAAAERARAAALEQFVSTGQCNEYGLKTLVAKAQSGDVIFFVARCDRIAQILLERGDTSPVGLRRARAVGVLAEPARALRLLAEHALQRGDVADANGESADRSSSHAEDEPGPLLSVSDLHPCDDDSDDSDDVAEGAACGSCRASTGAGRRANWAGTTGPVGDPAAFVKALATIDPTRMRELLRLRGPAGAYPWSANLSRRKEADHTEPYRQPAADPAPTSPPQTRVANLGLLDRPGHRIKTHGRGWKHRQPRPGVYLWRTPHGFWCRVDGTGTHPLGWTPGPYDLEGLAPDPRSAQERAFADLIRAHEHRAHEHRG